MQLQTLVIIRPGGLVSKKNTCSHVTLYIGLHHSKLILMYLGLLFDVSFTMLVPLQSHPFHLKTRHEMSHRGTGAWLPLSHPLSQRSQGCLVHVSACELHHITSCYRSVCAGSMSCIPEGHSLNMRLNTQPAY